MVLFRRNVTGPLMVFFALCMFMAPGMSGTCTLPDTVQGQWNIVDSGTVECAIDVNSTSLFGISFWQKTLRYNCFIQENNYYVFVSEPTDLFEQYNVNLYFCWYLQTISSTQYSVYELTEKVLYTIEERAKAFLNTTSPIVNDVCQIPFQSALPFKEMENIVST